MWDRTIAALGGESPTMVGDTLQDDSLAGMARRILAGAPRRFVLAGVSMGGMVSMEIMRVASERVQALALVERRGRGLGYIASARALPPWSVACIIWA